MTETSPIKASVVIPCHNSTRFVRETAKAAFAQTLSEMEVVFVDDGSTDDTREVIAQVMVEHGDRRARLVCQADSGLAAARNHGIAVARGQYILPLDSDDLIAPTMLQECAALLDGDPGIALVHTDREDFGDVNFVWPAGRFELERLKYFNQLNYCALYRRSMWEAIGGYRVNVSGLDDWDFWVAAAARGFAGRHLPRAHLKHRTRRGSLMWRILDQYERLHARIVLNNPAAYARDEIAGAARFLDVGEAAPFLRASRFIFLNQWLRIADSSAASRGNS
ncbi:MAG: glycosyl transferase family 2 [bacterium]|nr:glycosyl transferase family 2 [bacterium]